MSNYWHNPGISITFKHDHDSPEGSVHVEIGMNDFVQALVKELDHPMKIWTRTGLSKALNNAYATALEKVKEATNKAV
jgi:hypothetical protein